MCKDNDALGLQLVESYFQASNQSNLDKVGDLLHETCIYVSENTGDHVGKTRIINMMREFFGKFTKLRWDIENLEQISLGEFNCVCMFNAVSLSGEKVQRRCQERILYEKDKISHIYVRNME